MVKWSKTSPFHGGNPSSNLGRVTILKKYELLVRIFFALPRLDISYPHAMRAELANNLQLLFFILKIKTCC